MPTYVRNDDDGANDDDGSEWDSDGDDDNDGDDEGDDGGDDDAGRAHFWYYVCFNLYFFSCSWHLLNMVNPNGRN